MTGERWRPEADRVERDPRRKAYLEEYFTRGIHRAQHPSGARVTFGEFAAMRAEGTWDQFADENLNGRFKVEE